MRRGRRILAAAGMMALLLSNIGAVTQAVFAQEQVTAAEPAEAVEVTEPIEPATAAEDATDVQTATQDETPETAENDTVSVQDEASETAENDTVSVQDETSEIVEDDAVSGHDETADDATTAIEGTDDSVAADDPTSETNNGMEGEDTKESAEGANTEATEETAAAGDADSEETVEPYAESVTEEKSEQTTTTVDTADPETESEEETEVVDIVDAEEDPEGESTETITLIEQTIRSKAEDGASVSISGNLPENAEARMEPVTLNRDELDEYFGADVVDGMDRLAIYDISIYVNDEEWEPNDTVSVVVRNPDIKPVDETAEDADADAEDTKDAMTENIVVAHLEEGAEQIDATSSENSAEFEIKGTGEETSDQDAADPKEAETSASEATRTDDESSSDTEHQEDIAESQQDADKTDDSAEQSTEEQNSTEADSTATADATAAETTDTVSDDSAADAVQPAGETTADTAEVTAQVLESETEGNATTFETDGFSLYGFYTYTVDFYYEEAESRFPGGSEFQLSQVFEELGIDASVKDATDVTFSDETLIAVTQENNGDWTLTSLLPFTTSETLTVSYADRDAIVIRTEDAQYFSYTVSPDDVITPFAGQIVNSAGGNYIGKYDIFGGGNGLATRTSKLTGSNVGSGGSWDYKGTTFNQLKGWTISANGSSTRNNRQSSFITSSEAEIEWSGDLQKAFLSLGYYGDGSGTIKFELFKDNISDSALATVQINLNTDSTDSRPGDDVTVKGDWQYLTFDCTDLLKKSGNGPGNYIVRATRANGGYGIVPDMGWSIYGITYDTGLDHNTAIVGRISEIMVDKSKDEKADADLSPSIMPSGTGKVWYNVHGGETKDSINDADYLELKVKAGNNYQYIKFGDGNSYGGEKTVKVVAINSSGELLDEDGNIVSNDSGAATWTYDDIARPNNWQTATNGYSKFDNRFAFAMGKYSGMNQIPVVGVRKEMASNGTDVYGSVLLLVDVQQNQGNPTITKVLNILDQSDYEKAGVDSKGNKISFRFKVEPLNGAPMPKDTVNDEYTSTITMNSTVYNGYSESSVLGDFASMDAFLSVTSEDGNTYMYKVYEDATDPLDYWTYDTTVRYLKYTVKPYDATTVTQEITYEWVNEDGTALEKGRESGHDGTFTNTFSTRTPVKTGVNTGVIPWLMLPAGIGVMATYYVARHKARRRW